MSEIEFLNKIKIVETYHLNEKRNKESVARAHFVDHRTLMKIKREAFFNGLTSFRNKGKTVISVSTFNKGTLSLLVSLEENELIIISSIFSRQQFKVDNFIRTKNRMNCFNFITEKLNVEEVKKTKQRRTIQSNFKEDDNVFKNMMSKCSIQKI